MESFEDPAPILLRHFRGHHGPITCLAYNQHSNKLASSSTDKSVNLWNTEDRIRCFKFSGHSDVVNGVAWSHNGQLMATASKDRTIKVYTDIFIRVSFFIAFGCFMMEKYYRTPNV